MKNALFAAIFAATTALTGTVMADDAPAPAPSTSATPLQVRPSKPLTLAPAKDEGTPVGYKLLAGGVVIVAAGVWLKKKQGLSLGKGAKKKKKSAIDVLGRTSVGVRNELLVVEAEGTRLLIGMTGSSMQTLAVLQTPEGVIGEESPELPGEAKYADDDLPAAVVVKPAARTKTLREQLDEPEDDEEASEEVEQLSHRVRSLLDARATRKPIANPEPAPMQPRRAQRTQPQAKAAVPGQAKGLLLSMEDARNDEKITKLGDW